MMEGWTNPDPYVTKVEDVVCRDCKKTFQINAQYDKNGFPVSFQPKYCTECNMKPKITGAIGSSGTVSIESAKIPQRNVEGLVKDLRALSVGIEESCKEFQSFKKHIEHDIEEKEFEFDIHKNVTEQVIKNNKLEIFMYSQPSEKSGLNFYYFELYSSSITLFINYQSLTKKLFIV